MKYDTDVYNDFLADICHRGKKERRRRKIDEREDYRDIKFSRSKTKSKSKRKFFDFSSYDEDEE